MNQQLVSVIIPVFNAAGTLREAIESVLLQSFSATELIIIDGGSTDGSLEIIKYFEKQIAYFISERDSGVYEAMNKGIEKSKGEWIYILGADDELNSTEVLEVVMRQRRPEVKLIFGNVINTGRQHNRVPQFHKSSFGSGILWRNTLHQQSVFYHRTLFDQHLFNPKYKVLADYAFHLHIYKDKISHEYLDITIAKCEARGLSKKFEWSLYAEEIQMKRDLETRYPLIARLWVRPWALAKFIFKKISR